MFLLASSTLSVARPQQVIENPAKPPAKNAGCVVKLEQLLSSGNMEINLDRRLVDKQVFPAIDISRSGTRKEELLIEEADLIRIWILRKVLS